MAKATRTATETKHAEPTMNDGVSSILNDLPQDIDSLNKEQAVEALKRTSKTLEGIMAMPAARAAAFGGPQTPTSNFTSELNGIDFKKMIGGPLQAAVDAQVASALATVNFIQNVGFTNPEDKDTPRELIYADFTHNTTVVDEEGNEEKKLKTIKIPLLAMLPIPSLRIEHVEVDFNVKLNSVETSSVSDKLDIGAEIKAGWGPVSFKVTAAYQRQTATGIKVEKEYALNVKVRAVQDEIPAGLERILGMLAN
ncbi:MAG: hypothetical protein JWQ40_4431 [Segetibacter sp.]|nr:hypothetical protein [Segetibacter sp.]